MGYSIGDRVRLAIPYAGLAHDGSPDFVEVGDEGTVVAVDYSVSYPITVEFDGKLPLTCTLDEIERV